MAQHLELFMPVCEGVQHPHQKGIVHRDLKPSNVLVTIRDDHPVPKIIDFGIAKAAAQHLTERSLFTKPRPSTSRGRQDAQVGRLLSPSVCATAGEDCGRELAMQGFATAFVTRDRSLAACPQRPIAGANGLLLARGLWGRE